MAIAGAAGQKHEKEGGFSGEEYDSEQEQGIPMMPQPGPDAKRQQSTATNMNDNPAPTGFLAWAGFGCTLFALATLCIAFASPYWMQTYPNSFNTFQNIGLWEICMDNYMHYKDDSQEIYSGCWWLFSTDKKYWKLREWLLPRKYTPVISYFLKIYPIYTFIIDKIKGQPLFINEVVWLPLAKPLKLIKWVNWYW